MKIKLTPFALETGMSASQIAEFAKAPRRYLSVKKVDRPSKRAIRRQLARLRKNRKEFIVAPVFTK